MHDYAAWSRFILERETIPFAWDVSGQDCVRFLAGAVEALTGSDHLAGLPQWDSAASAARQIKRFGRGGGLAACVDRMLTSIAPAHAHRGDAAGIEHPEFGVMLMVVEGATLVGPAERGLVRAPRSKMIRAWSVFG